MYDVVFGVLTVLCVAVKLTQYAVEREAHKNNDQPDNAKKGDASFGSFQINYLVVYLLAVASDWLQGPYVYALYSDYGYDKSAIGKLFIAGFGSSAIFGTFVGSLADKYGRKSNVLLFCLTYALSCVTKHSPNYLILMVGRLLGGIATSILFSAFEAWLVYEHNRRGYNPDWLSETFSKAQFGNAVVAIVSGRVAGAFADQFGKVAPFDLSFAVLVATGFIVVGTWTENYGDASQTVSGGFANAWSIVTANRQVMLVGIIQSAFEGAMYTFVFLWTPALQTASDQAGHGEIPHGVIFSTFMVAVMIGSSLFTFLLKVRPIESFLRYIYAIGVFLFATIIFSTNVWIVYTSFVVFEMICGIYFPAMGTVRSRFVPEETRSAIMNFFRLPLNVIVVVTLYFNWETTRVFSFCALLMAFACVAQHMLYVSITTNGINVPSPKAPASSIEDGQEVEEHVPLSTSNPVE